MTRERVCFEGDDEVGVITDNQGDVITFIVFRGHEWCGIRERVQAVGLRLTRENLRGITRVKTPDLAVVPEVRDVVRPAAITIQGGYATTDGWFDAEDWEATE